MSIKQLEKDYTEDPTDFPTGLVENCYKYRKIPIEDLTIEQLRLLISQKIGIEHLTELALEKLNENILAEGDFYEGDLLEAVSRIPGEFWTDKAEEFQKLERLVKSNSEEINNEMGKKQFTRISERIKACSRQWL